MTPKATSATLDSLYEQIEDALFQAGGVCHRARSVNEAAAIISEIINGSATSHRTVWTAPIVQESIPALVAALQSRDCEVRSPESPADVRDQPFGLSMAEAAIAETGSVLLVERHLDDRSVGLMTETHIIICHEDTLVASLDDAAEMLSSVASQHGSYATLVTGPSRTADIERQLTIGVQGPSQLHVILIAEHT